MAILPNLRKEFGVEFDRYEEQFLMSDEMWLVGGGRDAGLPDKIGLKEINARPLIVDSAAYPGFKKLYQQKMEQLKLPVQTVFESDNVGTLKRVVESGVGWGFLPSHSIKKQVRTRRLHHVHVDDLVYQTTIHLYSTRSPGIKKMSDVFFRAIQQQVVGS
jgi:DNA-binding transcriptional LysR family regulator